MGSKTTFDTSDHVMLKGQVTGVTQISKKFKMLFLLGWLGLLVFLIFAIFTIDGGDTHSQSNDSDTATKAAQNEGKHPASDEPASASVITSGIGNGNAALHPSSQASPTIDLGLVAPKATANTTPANGMTAPVVVPAPNANAMTNSVANSATNSATSAMNGNATVLSAEQVAKQQADQLRMQQREQAFKSGMEVGGGAWDSNLTKPQNLPAASAVFSAIPGAHVSPAAADPAGIARYVGAQTAIDDDQNKQGRKEAFLREAQGKVGQDYLPATRQAAVSKYELKMGWKIPAFLIDGINSDLPGMVCAQVRENVYDSATGNYLLVPQGAKVCGTYDSQIALGQRRILIVWQRIVFDDGSSLALGGMPGIDQAGYAGFDAEVDHHYFQVFTSALMMSVISAGVQLSQPQAGTNSPPSAAQTAAGALGQQLGQVSSGMIQRNLKIQPTLSQQPGYRFHIQVTRDIVFPGPYPSIPRK